MATNPYERASGTISGLGQPSEPYCLSGQRWDDALGKCVTMTNFQNLSRKPAFLRKVYGREQTYTPEQQAWLDRLQAQKDAKAQYYAQYYAQNPVQRPEMTPELAALQQKYAQEAAYQNAHPNEYLNGQWMGVGYTPTRPTCPTGYTWNEQQGKCVTNPLAGNIMPEVAQQPIAVSSGSFQEAQPKAGQSDYAKLLAQAVDLMPFNKQSTAGLNPTQQGTADWMTGLLSGGSGTNPTYLEKQKEINATTYSGNPLNPFGKSAEQQRCEDLRDQGYVWVSSGNVLNPKEGKCIPSPIARNPYTDWTSGGGVIGGTPTTIDPSTLDVGERPIDITSMLDPSAYQGIQSLTKNVFGGNTLQQLENERIRAAEEDYNRLYGRASDDLTRRLNEQAESSGMFHSGSRQKTMAEELNRLDEERRTKLGAAIADIRGERPGLLLQEQEAQRKAWDTWSNYDLETKKSAVSSMLQGREQEYKRMLDNGTLTLDAFNGNLNLMTLYLDFILSSAKTEAEQNESAAKVTALINGLDDNDKNELISLISNISGAFF